MNKEEKTKTEKMRGYCVTCPDCGRMQQRSNTTESFIVCSRCNFEYYVYMNHGIIIEMPLDKAGDEEKMERIRKFILAMA